MIKTNIYRRNCIKILVFSGIFLFFVPNTWALDLSRKKNKTEKELYIPLSKKERCPVCGMFIRPYPKWITQVQFEDGSHYSFDGMKCMCRFYFNPEKFDSARKKRDIKRVLVRDYYTLKFIQHDTAFYVVGSDVFGPMGHELIPFDSQKNARIFFIYHNGLKILRFYQINPEMLDKLDKAKKTVNLE